MEAMKQHEKTMHCLVGTFAVENMQITEQTEQNLKRIATGELTMQQLIQEITTKYQQFTARP